MQDNDISIGKKYTITSKILGEERPYRVYLPASYNSTMFAPQHYPVLYILDGDSHFHSASGNTEYMSRQNQIPELIIVALSNTDRTRDLTPTHSEVMSDGKEAEFLKTSGGGEKFLQFIREELFPHIESTHRILPYRIFVGHSLGGLLALHTLLVSPEMFQAYIAIDPSFWWDNQLLIRAIKKREKTEKLSGAVYIALADHFQQGGNDLDGIDKGGRAFAKSLKSFTSPTFRSKPQRFKNEDHDSVHLLGMYHGLLYIFEGYKPPIKTFEDSSILIKHFEKVSERLGINIQSPERFTDMAGHEALWEHRDIDKAMKFFKLNVANYPTSPNVYASLAVAYKEKGNKKQAIKNLEKSLKIKPRHPEHKGIKEYLQKLRRK